MTKVAPGQPGNMPEVGCRHSPTACITFSRLGALAMSSMGRQTSAGKPLPHNVASLAEVHAGRKERVVQDGGLLQLCSQEVVVGLCRH